MYDPNRPVFYLTEYTYDANGNRQTEKRSRTTVDRSGGSPALVTQTITTTSLYDAQSRLRTNTVASRTGTNSVDDPGTQITATFYGAHGKPTNQLDALGRSTQQTSDARGNLIETKYPDNTVTRAVYDAQNRPTWRQDRVAAGFPACRILRLRAGRPRGKGRFMVRKCFGAAGCRQIRQAGCLPLRRRRAGGADQAFRLGQTPCAGGGSLSRLTSAATRRGGIRANRACSLAAWRMEPRAGLPVPRRAKWA